jgi:GNAT superfamily N-acetyltransferase
MADEIRTWLPQDADAIRPRMRDFLAAQYADGGDFKPTDRNVDSFVSAGIEAAKVGDPCVVAYEDEKLVGWCMWIGVRTPFDTRERSVFAFSDYVLPEFQRRGWSKRLRAFAKAVGRAGGYTRCDGMCLTPETLAAAKASGAVVFGVIGGIPLKE